MANQFTLTPLDGKISVVPDISRLETQYDDTLQFVSPFGKVVIVWQTKIFDTQVCRPGVGARVRSAGAFSGTCILVSPQGDVFVGDISGAILRLIERGHHGPPANEGEAETGDQQSSSSASTTK